MYIHTHTCVSGYQEVTAVFLRSDWELSNIDTLHIISTVEQNGRIRAKPLLTVRGYFPVQPDSIPHDLRLLLNRDLTKKIQPQTSYIWAFGSLPRWLLSFITSLFRIIPVLMFSPEQNVPCKFS